ncbi:uncharacterized protein LOC112572973 [Pomacea canaliculata]|uniref:uncharacterized protein LOC112572973 n=1 Tax=Pomacea canaliculata TaxID=400727 RepID=UPI000D731191|nr:uncharacterized protein LOC112572973 [Pomacea canaliculata]
MDPGQTSHSHSTSTTIKTTPSIVNGGPIIQESQESAEYQKALQTVVGTALGVIFLVGIIALIFLLYRLRHQRRRPRLVNGTTQHSPSINRSVSIDAGGKPVPSVLVLYAFDCAVHEAVVVALSGLLMEACGVTVCLDVFEEASIMEQGLEDWLGDRLQEADFIIVVCSLGARLRCSKKRVRFRTEQNRTIPDYFAVAVDYVAEKLRAERSKGMDIGKFIAVVMDYSRLSDIPPQLEAAKTFTLMGGFYALCSHLASMLPHKVQLLEERGPDVNAWQQTEAGQELWAALGQARDFFQVNPNWLEDRLEPPPPRARTKTRHRRRHHDGESHEQPLLPKDSFSTQDMADLNLSTGDDAALQGRRWQTEGRMWFVNSRPNSLPSSLTSSQPSAAHTLQGVSRSVDSFPVAVGLDLDGQDRPSCLACRYHQQGWAVSSGHRPPCPVHTCSQQQASILLTDTDGETDIELGVEVSPEQRCSRSKSLPAVGEAVRTSPSYCPHLSSSQTLGEGWPSIHLGSSRTVLQAEVHKEWGVNKDVEAHKENATKTKETEKEMGDPEAPWKQQSQPLKGLEIDIIEEDGPKEWRSDTKVSGRASPSSLSSVSTISSGSAGNTGSDSLERDLLSLTMPRIFDHGADHRTFSLPVGSALGAPPRSFSFSAPVSSPTSLVKPAPCLTPLHVVPPPDLTNLSFGTYLQCDLGLSDVQSLKEDVL